MSEHNVNTRWRSANECASTLLDIILLTLQMPYSRLNLQIEQERDWKLDSISAGLNLKKGPNSEST